MHPHITHFVELIQGQLMMNLAIGSTQNLYDIASALVATHDDASTTYICQAYEIVKHQLIG